MLTVGLAGFGAIGVPLARALDAGVDGLHLIALAVRDRGKAERILSGFKSPPRLVDPAALAEADIVVEAMPAAAFDLVADPAVDAGRIFVPASAAALLTRPALIARAKQTGARILVPSGALLGLDGVRAAAEGGIDRVVMITRKPPAGLEGAPYLTDRGITLVGLTEPRCVFAGSAREAALGFPANVNVMAALSLAGIGPDRTEVEIWADPGVTRNTHRVEVEAAAVRFTVQIEGVPSPENPRTGMLTPFSVLACLRGLVAPFRSGS